MAEFNLAVIPARGGSKRIPGKNVKIFLGKPLIAYTIQAAQQSRLFKRIIVSTDSPEIAEVARQCGAEVPGLRAAALADDFTPVSVVTVDLLKQLDPAGDQIQFVAQLLPNCPLRTAADIVESHQQFSGGDAESQISVVRFGWQNPWWAMRRNEKHQLEPVFDGPLKARSQDLPELFCPTGAVWWARSSTLRRTGTYQIDRRTGWEIPWQRGIDIDTEDDWLMARVLANLAHPETPMIAPSRNL